MNKIYFIVIALVCMLYIVFEVRKKKFTIKESFWWIFASLVMIILSIFPYSINWLAKLFNVEYPPSLFFVFCIIFLIFVNFSNSKKIADQQMKIIDLAQEISILNEKSNKGKSHEKK